MSKVFPWLLSFVTPIAAIAQGPVCPESKIREAVQKGTYFGTGERNGHPIETRKRFTPPQAASVRRSELAVLFQRILF